MKTRRRFTADSKAKVALEALRTCKQGVTMRACPDEKIIIEIGI